MYESQVKDKIKDNKLIYQQLEQQKQQLQNIQENNQNATEEKNELNNMKQIKKMSSNNENQVQQITQESIYQNLYQKYSNIQDKRVYLKIDNTEFNTVPFNTKKYLSGLFCDLRKILQEQEGQIINQDYDNSNENIQQELDGVQFKLQDKEQEIQQLKEEQELKQKIKSKINDNVQNTDLNYVLPKNLQYSNSNQEPTFCQDLQFDSNFESGNLFSAYKIHDNEYDLVLQNDINSKGNTQWFFFSIAKTTKNQKMKNDSLFNHGMQPVCFSLKNKELGWHRCGTNIQYSKSNIVKDGVSTKDTTNSSNQNQNNQTPLKKQNEQKGLLYQLSFDLQFQEENDKIYIAHCYPYTYSQLNQFLDNLQKDPKRSQFVKRKILCKTLAKNNCDLLIITSNSKYQSEKKQGVVLTGRQHPGETAGSVMIEGTIKFLTDPNNPIAEYLRRKCIFKIIPMVNPDGVIHGNYRCNIAGVDLNRQWEDTSQLFHPTVFYIKQLIENFKRERQILMICDLHGHSKHMNSFFYGNPWEQDQTEPRLMPLIASQLNPMISYKQSTFSLNPLKNSTMRQNLFYSTNISQIYTFEASFFGWKQENKEKKHFTYECYQNLGRDLCITISKYLQMYTDNYRVFSNDELDNNPQYREFDSQYDPSQSKKSQNLKQNILENNQLLQNPSGYSSGSDSNPSEDELNQKEMKSLNQKKKQQKNKNKGEFNLSTHSPTKCRCCKNSAQHKQKEISSPQKKQIQPLQLLKQKQRSNYNSPEKPIQKEQYQNISSKYQNDSPVKQFSQTSKNSKFGAKSSNQLITYADAQCQTDQLTLQEMKFIEQQEKQLIQNRKTRKNNKSLYNPYTQNQRKINNINQNQRNHSSNIYSLNPNQTIYQASGYQNIQNEQQMFNNTNINFTSNNNNTSSNTNNQNINLQLSNNSISGQNSYKFQQRQGNFINGPDISVSILIGKQGFSFKEEKKYDRKKKIYLIDKSCQTFLKLEDLIIIINTQINNIRRLHPKADDEEIIQILCNKNNQQNSQFQVDLNNYKIKINKDDEDQSNNTVQQIYNFISKSEQKPQQNQNQNSYQHNKSVEKQNKIQQDSEIINIQDFNYNSQQETQTNTSQNTKQHKNSESNNLLSNSNNLSNIEIQNSKQFNTNNDISVVFDSQSEQITDQLPLFNQKQFLNLQDNIKNQDQQKYKKRAQTSSLNQRNRINYSSKFKTKQLQQSNQSYYNSNNSRYQQIQSIHSSNNNISTNNFIVSKVKNNSKTNILQQQNQEKIFQNYNLQNLLNSTKQNDQLIQKENNNNTISKQIQQDIYLESNINNINLEKLQQQYNKKNEISYYQKQNSKNNLPNQIQNSQYNSFQNLQAKNTTTQQQYGQYKIIKNKKERSSNSLHQNTSNHFKGVSYSTYQSVNNNNNQQSQLNSQIEKVEIGNQSQEILNQNIIQQIQSNTNNKLQQSRQLQNIKSKAAQNPIKVQQQHIFYQQQNQISQKQQQLQQQSININQNEISFQQKTPLKQNTNNTFLLQQKIKNSRNNQFKQSLVQNNTSQNVNYSNLQVSNNNYKISQKKQIQNIQSNSSNIFQNSAIKFNNTNNNKDEYNKNIQNQEVLSNK